MYRCRTSSTTFAVSVDCIPGHVGCGEAAGRGGGVYGARRLPWRVGSPWHDSHLERPAGNLEPDRSLLHEAGILPGAHLRSLDALHAATALRVEASMMVAYDGRQRDAAEAVGLRVIAPA